MHTHTYNPTHGTHRPTFAQGSGWVLSAQCPGRAPHILTSCPVQQRAVTRSPGGWTCHWLLGVAQGFPLAPTTHESLEYLGQSRQAPWRGLFCQATCFSPGQEVLAPWYPHGGQLSGLMVSRLGAGFGFRLASSTQSTWLGSLSRNLPSLSLFSL